MQRHFKLILVAIILAGAALRVAGISGDMWLDEVWSYDLAQKIQRPLDVLLARDLQIDNNHPLNTLYLWMVGFQRHWWIYRVPSILFGLAGLVYFPFIAARWGRREAILATALFSFSHPLTFFCSEARGYAMLLFFSLLAFDAADRYTTRPSWGSAVAFATGCIMAMLSHLTFAFLYGGLVVWTVYRLTGGRWRTLASFDVLRLNAIPALFTAVLFFIFGRHVIVGGGPPVSRFEEVAIAAASIVALRGPLPLEAAAMVAVIALAAWVLVALARRRSDLWILLLFAGIVVPLLVLFRQMRVMKDHPQPIQPRYFLVILPVLIIAISTLVPKAGHRMPALIALTIFFTANVWQTVNWLRIGRAHHSDAVLYMAQNSPGGDVAIISDNLLRTTTLLRFYGDRVMPPGKKLIIFDGEEPIPADPGPPLWAVRAHYLTNTPPGMRYADPRTRALYVFDREFTHFGLSGYSWYVYRRQ
jgi:hypothetical protein